MRSETAQSIDRFCAALAGLRIYQSAERAPPPPAMPVVAQAGRAVLRDYGGDGPPCVFVPSLINPPRVLDMREDASLLRWLSGQGVRPMLVDWGDAGPEDRAIDVAGHVETMLLPMLRSLGEPAFLAGYCLGGTMAMAAAARYPARGLVLIAAPWHFEGFGDGRTLLRGLWDAAGAAAERMGVLPIEVLQTAFWQIDPARTVAKFERLATLDPNGDAAKGFVALEDWANDGPPLTCAAGRELLVDMVGEDRPGEGTWMVEGASVDPGGLHCPILNIVSTSDRIVPAASAARVGTVIELALGHVGMIVGSRGKEQLWEPLSAWLSQVRSA